MDRRTTPSILAALEGALAKVPPADQDAATVALAKRYAATLDESQALVAEAEDTYAEALAAEDVALAARVAKLAAKVDAQAVAALIGPKMLDALAQLQLTPAARRAVVPPGGGGGNGERGTSALGNLRALGSNRAKALDASAS